MQKQIVIYITESFHGDWIQWNFPGQAAASAVENQWVNQHPYHQGIEYVFCQFGSYIYALAAMVANFYVEHFEN